MARLDVYLNATAPGKSPFAQLALDWIEGKISE
jgi:hypothetical protein